MSSRGGGLLGRVDCVASVSRGERMVPTKAPVACCGLPERTSGGRTGIVLRAETLCADRGRRSEGAIQALARLAAASSAGLVRRADTRR